MDKNDLESVKHLFDNFDLFSNINENYLLNPRAGIVILSKKHITQFLSFTELNNDITIPFKIKKDILKSEKTYFVYVFMFPLPPPYIKTAMLSKQLRTKF